MGPAGARRARAVTDPCPLPPPPARRILAAILPGIDEDATPGAADIGAERFVEHYLGAERLAELCEMLDLSPDDDGASIRAQLGRLADRSPEIRHLVGLAIAAVYGSWSGTDTNGALVTRPLGWDLAGFSGPARGRGPIGA